LLSDGANRAEKDARLAAWLRQKAASKVVRFQQQPTVLFNE
jgi:hypothetical protein